MKITISKRVIIVILAGILSILSVLSCVVACAYGPAPITKNNNTDASESFWYCIYYDFHNLTIINYSLSCFRLFKTI